MVKDTKSNPTLEQGGVKKIFFTEYQLFTNENLTAIPWQGAITDYFKL